MPVQQPVSPQQIYVSPHPTAADAMHDDCVSGRAGFGLGEGGMRGPGTFNVWLETPVAVETVAEAMVWLPGHHAMKSPSPVVAVTLVPFPRASVTPLTPTPVRPSTNV
jgi:hypothetical protein